MFANPQIETMARSAMQELQLERLRKVIRWVGEKSSFYRHRFQKAGIASLAVEDFDDFRRFPFLGAADLRGGAAYDILTLPLSGILRYHYVQQESGDILKLFTNGDIGRNVEMMARALVAAEVNSTTVVGILGDLSSSELMDVQYALEFIGAGVVALGADYRARAKVLERIRMDAIVGTPQIIMQFMIQLQAAGRDVKNLFLPKILCINPQSIQNPLQRHLKGRIKTEEVYNLYAPPEIGTAGMLFQCSAHSGQHVQEDAYYPEVLQFGTNQPVEQAQMGELVVTSLMAEAMPLIRYRTGQAVSVMHEPCSCGRTLLRLVTPFSFT